MNQFVKKGTDRGINIGIHLSIAAFAVECNADRVAALAGIRL